MSVSLDINLTKIITASSEFDGGLRTGMVSLMASEVKSLHTISHNQISIISSAIEKLQRLKQVAEMNSELETKISASKTKLIKRSSTVKNITAANFIDNILVVTKEATVRFTVNLPESMYRDLSILAAETGKTKADIVRIVLSKALHNVKKQSSI